MAVPAGAPLAVGDAGAFVSSGAEEPPAPVLLAAAAVGVDALAPEAAAVFVAPGLARSTPFAIDEVVTQFDDRGVLKGAAGVVRSPTV